MTIASAPLDPKSLEVFSYSVKFVCGILEEAKGEECVVRPGQYATEINIHNYQDTEAHIDKFVLPLVERREIVGREPRFVWRKAKDSIVLPPNTATLDDGCRIGELLFGTTPPSPLPLTIGFLEILSNQELAITAVYTASSLKSDSLSIAVEQIKGKVVKQTRG